VVVVSKDVNRFQRQRTAGLLTDLGVVVQHCLDPAVIAAQRMLAADVPEDVLGEKGTHALQVAGVLGVERVSNLLRVGVLDHDFWTIRPVRLRRDPGVRDAS
jgi:hypothetical protein